MSAGKAASQAGHAFLGAFFSAQSLTPSVAAEYAALAPGTKVCLQADLAKIELLADKLSFLGIPHFLVWDQGCENFFGGKPIVTALGVGPLLRHQSNKLLKGFSLFDLRNPVA